MTNQVKVRYHMVETIEYVQDTGPVTSYGIRCEEAPAADDQGVTNYYVIPDISTSSVFVEELIRKLTLHNADPVHLRDLIEDYIG